MKQVRSFWKNNERTWNYSFLDIESMWLLLVHCHSRLQQVFVLNPFKGISSHVIVKSWYEVEGICRGSVLQKTDWRVSGLKGSSVRTSYSWWGWKRYHSRKTRNRRSEDLIKKGSSFPAPSGMKYFQMSHRWRVLRNAFDFMIKDSKERDWFLTFL